MLATAATTSQIKCEGRIKQGFVEQRDVEDAYRLEALRSAVQVGIEDIAAGKFKAFEKKDSLQAHLKSITDKAIATR